MDILRKPKKDSIPIVIAAFNKTKKTYVTVGVTPTASDERKNASSFGKCFQRAALKTNSAIQKHFFDSSVIEILEDDIHKFLEFLHLDLTQEKDSY